MERKISSMRIHVRMTGWMSAFGADAARKGHVDRFAGELGLHGGLSELFAAGVERGFDSGLGLVDFLTAGAALFGRELTEALHESRHGAAFADVLGLGVFQGSGLLCLSEVLTRGLDEFGKRVLAMFTDLDFDVVKPGKGTRQVWSMAAAHPHPRVTPDAEDACCDSLLRKKARMVSGFFSPRGSHRKRGPTKNLILQRLVCIPKILKNRKARKPAAQAGRLRI